MLGKAVFDHFRGAGWFADPKGKPSFFVYARGLLGFVLGAIFLRTNPATEEAFAAAKNSPTRGSGDGVTVSSFLPGISKTFFFHQLVDSILCIVF